jgi:hypothetical protein
VRKLDKEAKALFDEICRKIKNELLLKRKVTDIVKEEIRGDFEVDWCLEGGEVYPVVRIYRLDYIDFDRLEKRLTEVGVGRIKMEFRGRVF